MGESHYLWVAVAGGEGKGLPDRDPLGAFISGLLETKSSLS